MQTNGSFLVSLRNQRESSYIVKVHLRHSTSRNGPTADGNARGRLIWRHFMPLHGTVWCVFTPKFGWTVLCDIRPLARLDRAFHWPEWTERSTDQTGQSVPPISRALGYRGCRNSDSLLLRTQFHQRFSLLNLWIGQNIALSASLTATNFAIHLLFAFSVFPTSLISFQESYSNMNCLVFVVIRKNERVFALIWLVVIRKN